MSNSSSDGGIGFCGLLTVLFIGLKLTAVIMWPWVWVLGPLWFPLAIACFGCLEALIVACRALGIDWLVETFT